MEKIRLTMIVVIDGVANDKVFNTIELFFDGLIDKKEAINRLFLPFGFISTCQ